MKRDIAESRYQQQANQNFTALELLVGSNIWIAAMDS